ncbi:hypothetical protein A2U01_0097793, partial [Trifolium medium]|nr:hypothetical protein [Trifolium medium]
TEKEVTDCYADASARKKHGVSCGIVTVQTMEVIIVETELPTKYYTAVSGGQHYFRNVNNLHATVINVNEQ